MIKFATMKNPIKCEKCSAFCKNKTTLSDHTKRVHSNIPHQCDLCGNFYKTRASLKIYIDGHDKLQHRHLKLFVKV